MESGTISICRIQVLVLAVCMEKRKKKKKENNNNQTRRRKERRKKEKKKKYLYSENFFLYLDS